MIRLTRDFGYQLLFVICVIVPTFNNYELTFGTWLLAAMLTIKRRYSYTIVVFVAISVAILLISIFSAFFYSAQPYNYVRDITYLLKPILGLLIGYQLCKSVSSDRAFRLIVLTGLVLAIIHLLTLFIGFFIYKIRDMHLLRFYGGYFSDFEVYALVVVIFNSAFKLRMSRNQKWLLILIIGLSCFLYLARTNFIQFGILVIAMLGYLRLTPKAIKVVTVFLIIGILGYTAVYISNPRRSGTGFEAFLYKVKIAPIEPFKTKINEDDWKDFNDNYRSFENIITVEQVSREGIGAVLFGKGLGSEIDLGREMWTNDGEMIRYVPALHNSYMTIFLKSGLAGVFLLLLFIYYLFRYRRSEIPQVTYINYLLVGTAFFLILSNWVFMGLYFKVDNKAILIAFLICYREILIKQNRLENTENS